MGLTWRSAGRSARPAGIPVDGGVAAGVQLRPGQPVRLQIAAGARARRRSARRGGPAAVRAAARTPRRDQQHRPGDGEQRPGDAAGPHRRRPRLRASGRGPRSPVARRTATATPASASSSPIARRPQPAVATTAATPARASTATPPGAAETWAPVSSTAAPSGRRTGVPGRDRAAAEQRRRPGQRGTHRPQRPRRGRRAHRSAPRRAVRRPCPAGLRTARRMVAAVATADSTARALFRHSVSSATGSESATIPPPACT